MKEDTTGKRVKYNGSTDELISDIRLKDEIDFVELQFTDINGMIKSVTIPESRLEESLKKGTWFDGSSIEGFTRICESDMYLKPDSKTYIKLPFEDSFKKTGRFICDIFMADGTPFEGDPRYILKKELKEAKALGLEYCVGPELEFFLFKPKDTGELSPAPHDVAGYFDFSARDLATEVRKELVSALESIGFDIEMAHHEVAPGQHEIDFHYSDALSTADRAITLKHVIKSIANRKGLYATFMPKPIFGENGSGMHVHQSFKDTETGRNAFFDEKDKFKLSGLAKSFVAGQLLHAKGFCAVTAPNVNSYKRLVPGFEAPVYICWGQMNRSALIRIPSYHEGQDSAVRAELRCPDPSCNPYLAFAVMLKAGLDGIEKKMTPPEPVEDDVYDYDTQKKLQLKTLPGSLGEAINELEKDKVIMDALGPHTGQEYIRAKRAEWDEYRIQVTPWEHRKYFERT